MNQDNIEMEFLLS